MSAKILTIEDAKKASVRVIENGRGTQAVHDHVVAMQANRRSGTANTKTKAEVKLTGSKPWRQKGTGRARAGYAASPIWRGGGVVFGPKPRDYSKRVPKKVRKLAFTKALSARIQDGDVLMIKSFDVAEPKTKKFVAEIAGLVPDVRKVLVIGLEFSENTYKAGRNHKPVLLATAADVNTEQLLAFDKIVITEPALEVLAKRTEAA